MSFFASWKPVLIALAIGVMNVFYQALTLYQSGTPWNWVTTGSAVALVILTTLVKFFTPKPPEQ